MNKKSLREIVTFTRASGATWMNSAGNIVGVDFSSSTVANTAGLKQFVLNSTLGTNRGWTAGDTVIVSQQGGSISLTGTVDSYNATSQNLIVNVTTASGSGSASSWRIGSTVPRLDYGYQGATLYPKGILIEESRTNSIRNNTMQGAVAGTPGTLPTNWALGGISGGLATQVVGTGTENGITYIDIRIFGTNSSGSSVFPGVFFDTTTGIAGTTGQVWSESLYLSMAAGTGFNFELAVHEADSGGVFLRSTTFSGTGGIPTSGALNTRRRSGSVTLGASTAFVRPLIATTVPNGSSIDITLRIGLPQLEQGAFATSVIPTTTAAATRSADVARVNTLTPWFNASEGTLFVQAQDMSDAAHATSEPRAASINDGTTNNTINICRVPASAQSRARVVTGGSIVFNSLTTAWPLATQAKIGLAYKANDFAACLGGGAVATSASGAVPTVSALTIGNITTAGTSGWVGWIQRITYYPRRLTNTQLQLITGS